MAVERFIKDHIVTPVESDLIITVEDKPGSGGANHLYVVHGLSTQSNPSWYSDEVHSHPILFQNGPVAEGGPNGITVEALLAICADRLRCFQAGSFPSKANACALTKIEEAMHWLQQRTLERMRRGVEGKEVA